MTDKVVLQSGVDPKVARDLNEVADALKRAREEGDKLGQMRSEGVDEASTRLERLGRTANNLNEIRLAAGAMFGAVRGATVELVQMAARGDQTARAVQGLRGGFESVTASTNGTVSALAAYRAQQTLVNSGLRISQQELALVARHAREHRDVTKSAEEAVQELTEALRENDEGGLRKYGIAMQQGASRAQTFERSLRQMREAAHGMQPAARTLTESVNLLGTASEEAASGFALMVTRGLGLDTLVSDLSTGIAQLARDLGDLNEQAERTPANRSQAMARAAATTAYTTAQRGIGQNLRDLGFSQDEVSRLVPSTALGRLTPEQISARATELARVRTLIDAQNMQTAPDASLTLQQRGRVAATIVQGDGSAQMVVPPSMASMTTLSAAESATGLAALRRRRTGNAQDAVREQIRGLLRGIGTGMASDDAANNRPTREQQRRDAAAPQQSGPTSLDAQLAQVEADIGSMEALTANMRDARFGTRDEAMARMSALQERQIDLIQQIARASVVGENDNAHAQRAAAAGQRVAELRGGRAQTADTEALLNAEKERSHLAANAEYQREQALRRTMAEQDAYSRTPEGRAEARRNTVRGARQDAFGSRERNRAGGEATLADLRDPAVQGEAERDHAMTSQIERERAHLDERLRVQESFSEQWERLHRRQASATTASVDVANSAIENFGKAFGKHVNLILSGQESVGEGVLNMVSEVVMAIGQEAIVKAAMEFAEGVAAAAGVLTAPLAPGHFAAAAAFGAVGVAALGAGAIMGAARGSGGASTAAAAPALPPPTQQDAAASEGGRNITIVYGAGILGSPRDLARHVRDVLEEGEQAGVRLPSRVVERAA